MTRGAAALIPDELRRIYRHPDGRATTVPHHKGRDLAVPLIRAILAGVQLPPEEFPHRIGT